MAESTTITPQFIYDPFDTQKITGVIFPVELFQLNNVQAASILDATRKMIEEFHWRNIPPKLQENHSIVVGSYYSKE